MRKLFGELLSAEMQKNPDIFLLAGDVGYGVLDMKQSNAHNMGAAEQLMLGAAVGLSYEGKIPVCYTITPFLLLRPYEWIRNYLQEEGANVKLVGSGRDYDYKHLGSTHMCNDESLFDYGYGEFDRIPRYEPRDSVEMKAIFQEFLYTPSPAYLNLRR